MAPVYRPALLLGALILCIPGPPPAAAQVEAENRSGRLRIYLDCRTRCEMDYLRTEIAFADFMRDRNDAEVHILITQQQTGAGGSELTLQFIGLGEFAGVTDELQYSSRPNTSPADLREGIARMLKLGLTRYAARTALAQSLDLDFDPPEGADFSATSSSANDPWNNWVFRVGFGGFANGESSYRNRNLNAFISANRVTPQWKTNLSLNARDSRSETEVGDKTVVSTQIDRSASTLTVRSINEHWSIGGRTNLNRSSFINRDLALRVAPAIEFNFFPYSESTRRQITVQYSVGANEIDYAQETIFDRTNEALMDQSVRLSGDVRQRWGSVNLSVEGSHYLHDISKYRLETFGGIELRLFRGLGLNFNGRAERVHDQLHLAKGSLTPEQILLRQQQVATSFRYNFNFNLSYSFGSIFNTVVNPRMEN